jgi:hypothetical protein
MVWNVTACKNGVYQPNYYLYLALQVAKAMEEMDAHFSDKFVLREKSMEEKQQKEIAELTVPLNVPIIQ